MRTKGMIEEHVCISEIQNSEQAHQMQIRSRNSDYFIAAGLTSRVEVSSQKKPSSVS